MEQDLIPWRLVTGRRASRMRNVEKLTGHGVKRSGGCSCPVGKNIKSTLGRNVVLAT